jgi:hypothetical protein
MSFIITPAGVYKHWSPKVAMAMAQYCHKIKHNFTKMNKSKYPFSAMYTCEVFYKCQ